MNKDTTLYTAKKALQSILVDKIFTKNDYYKLIAIQKKRLKMKRGIKLPNREFIFKRKSKRRFSGRLSVADFENIISSCYRSNLRQVKNKYSHPHRTYPSAGGLNCCEIYIWTNLKKFNGIYKYNPYRNELIIINEEFNPRLLFPYHDNFSIDKIRFAIIFAINILPGVIKYGNKGLLYSILEVGHAAQNFLLLSEHYNIESLPIGSISTNYMATFIADSHILPVYAIVGSGMK